MRGKSTKCKICKKVIPAKEYYEHKDNCQKTIFINLKTGAVKELHQNTVGNPVDNKEKCLAKGTYLVLNKYPDKPELFWVAVSDGTKKSDIFEPKYDFTINDIEKIFVRYKKYRNRKTADLILKSEKYSGEKKQKA